MNYSLISHLVQLRLSLLIVLVVSLASSSTLNDVNPLSEETLPFLRIVDRFYTYLTQSNSTSCASEAGKFEQAIQDEETWALIMVDSSGRPASGMLNGGLTFPGLFSQCLQIVETNSSDLNGPSIEGKHCLAQFTIWGEETPPGVWKALWNIVANSTIRLGLCFPSGCDKNDAEIALKSALESVFQVLKQEVQVNACQTNNAKFTLEPGAIFVTVLLSMLVLISITGTIYDLTRNVTGENQNLLSETKLEVDSIAIRNNISTEKLFQPEIKLKNDKLHKVLLAFSIRKNGAAILKTESGEGSILIFNGIRFLSMLWIVILHSFSFALNWIAFQNPTEAQTNPSNFLSQIYANGSFSVDSFFYISGFLQSFLYAKHWSNSVKIPRPHIAVLHRYLRMTPLMMILIAVGANLLPWLGNGPFWSTSTVMFDSWCRENWWLNALYLQNFIHTGKMCFGHTWYSAVDFQFFIVALILLPILNWKKVIGFIAILLLLLTTIGITAYLTSLNHYPAMPYLGQVTFSQDSISAYSMSIYIKPFCRAAPYLIGIIMGKILFELKDNVDVIRQRYVVLGWTLVFITIPALLFATWPVYKGYPFSADGEIAYGALARTIWALSLSWITYACIAGRGGFVSTLLSWKAFVPLSKLTYSAYLVNPVIISIFYGSRQISYDFSTFFLIYLVMGNLIITFGVSFVLSILFEAPFVELEKIFLKSR